MTEKELTKYLNELIVVVSRLKEKPNFKRKIGVEANTKESLTSQEHYTVTDLIKTFIREKSDVIFNAKTIDDEDEPDFPTVDAHDDIVDIQDKLESAESVVETTEKTTALNNDEKSKNDDLKAVVEEVEKTETKGTE